MYELQCTCTNISLCQEPKTRCCKFACFPSHYHSLVSDSTTSNYMSILMYPNFNGLLYLIISKSCQEEGSKSLYPHTWQVYYHMYMKTNIRAARIQPGYSKLYCTTHINNKFNSMNIVTYRKYIHVLFLYLRTSSSDGL